MDAANNKKAYRMYVFSDEIPEKKKKGKKNKAEKEYTKIDNDKAIIRQKCYREAKSNKRIIKRTVLAVMLTAAILLFIVLNYFKVSSISVSGSEIYESTQIQENIDMPIGKNIFSVDCDAVASAIKLNMKYVDDVRVTISIPNTLKIQITESSPEYYIEIDGEYFMATSELEVMEKTTDIGKINSLNIKKLKLANVKSAFVGKSMGFKKENDYKFFCKVLDEISASPIYDKIILIDMSDKFDIKLIYEDRFEIDLGDEKDIDTKLTLAAEYIKTLKDGERGTIDTRDISLGGFVENKNINLSL